MACRDRRSSCAFDAHLIAIDPDRIHVSDRLLGIHDGSFLSKDEDEGGQKRGLPRPRPIGPGKSSSEGHSSKLP
jgi:hypothetical protein